MGEPRMSKADLLLHPHRLRIVQAFLGHDGLTTADLRRALPDIPTATVAGNTKLIAAAPNSGLRSTSRRWIGPP